jgi:hypothetical protein
MNVLDENIIASQREALRRWRIPFRQIGHELVNRGAKDPQIIPLLLRLKQPTFFTRDFDFFERQLCHPGYCLAWLNVRPDKAALFIRRFLGHPDFCTRLQRLGRVARIHPEGVEYWRWGQARKVARDWPANRRSAR